MRNFDALVISNFANLAFNGVKTANLYGNTIVVHTVNAFTSLEHLGRIMECAETFFKNKIKNIEVSPCFSSPNELVYSIIFE